MRFALPGALMTALTVAGAALPARAQNQSLADVARKEEQRRQQVKEPAKVITNKDLGDVPPAVAPPADGKAASSDQAKSDGKDQDKGKAGEPAKDQAYWAGRKKDLQTQLDRDQTFADALQTKINSLTADFTARDDPAQRAVIARDRQKALAELDRLQKAVQDDKKALADLDDEARRAGVPPGWLR